MHDLSLKVLPIHSPQNKDTTYSSEAYTNSPQKPLPFPFQLLFPKSCTQEPSAALKPPYQTPLAVTFRQKLGAAQGKRCKRGALTNSSAAWATFLTLSPFTSHGDRGSGSATPPGGVVRSKTAGRSAQSVRALPSQPGVKNRLSPVLLTSTQGEQEHFI